jgi:hypothetical protein
MQRIVTLFNFVDLTCTTPYHITKDMMWTFHCFGKCICKIDERIQRHQNPILHEIEIFHVLARVTRRLTR